MFDRKGAVLFLSEESRDEEDRNADRRPWYRGDHHSRRVGPAGLVGYQPAPRSAPGLTMAERRDLDRRFDALARKIRWERRDWDRGYRR